MIHEITTTSRPEVTRTMQFAVQPSPGLPAHQQADPPACGLKRRLRGTGRQNTSQPRYKPGAVPASHTSNRALPYQPGWPLTNPPTFITRNEEIR
jgi:hypothetical protein